jgi:hypothetical protein
MRRDEALRGDPLARHDRPSPSNPPSRLTLRRQRFPVKPFYQPCRKATRSLSSVVYFLTSSYYLRSMRPIRALDVRAVSIAAFLLSCSVVLRYSCACSSTSIRSRCVRPFRSIGGPFSSGLEDSDSVGLETLVRGVIAFAYEALLSTSSPVIKDGHLRLLDSRLIREGYQGTTANHVTAMPQNRDKGR